MTTPPPPKPRLTLDKALTLSAVGMGMGIGFGTCGLVTLTHAGEGPVWTYLAEAGSGLFFLSLVSALILGLIRIFRN